MIVDAVKDRVEAEGQEAALQIGEDRHRVGEVVDPVRTLQIGVEIDLGAAAEVDLEAVRQGGDIIVITETTTREALIAIASVPPHHHMLVMDLLETMNGEWIFAAVPEVVILVTSGGILLLVDLAVVRSIMGLLEGAKGAGETKGRQAYHY